MGEGQRDRTDLDIALPIFPPFAPTTGRTRKTGSAKKRGRKHGVASHETPFYAPTPPLTFYFLFDHRRSHITHRRNSYVQKKKGFFPLFSQPFPISPFFFSLFFISVFLPLPAGVMGGNLVFSSPSSSSPLFFPRVNPGLIRISPLRCPASSLHPFSPFLCLHPPPILPPSPPGMHAVSTSPGD